MIKSVKSDCIGNIEIRINDLQFGEFLVITFENMDVQPCRQIFL